MKKMRNIFAAAMVLVMAAMMTGCTKQQAPETEQTNTAQTEEPNMRTVLQLGASRPPGILVKSPSPNFFCVVVKLQ